MKNSEWVDFLLENFELINRQKEFQKRGELEQNLLKLRESIFRYQQFSNTGHNHNIYKTMQAQQQAIHDVLILLENENHPDFYRKLVKTLTTCSVYESYYNAIY